MDDYDSVAATLPSGADRLFMPRTQRQALAELVRAILAGEPFVALTGDLGVGKTTVLNAAVAVLAERGLRVMRIGNPDGTPLRLPQIIGELLGNAPSAITNEDIERLFDALTLNMGGNSSLRSTMPTICTQMCSAICKLYPASRRLVSATSRLFLSGGKSSGIFSMIPSCAISMRE